MLKTNILEKSKKFATEIVEGLNHSVTQFHAVEYCTEKLVANGFTEINEREKWNLNKGGKYFYVRSNSALVAFTIGKNVNLNSTCFKIIGTHTDSPNLRFAPVAYNSTSKYERFNLQTYGGGLWQTWFDRDLSVAGKLVVKDENTGSLKSQLVRVEYPLLRIPHLAIHLQTDRSSKFEWNNENHLKAILSTTFFDGTEENNKTNEPYMNTKLGSKLTSTLAKSANVKPENIIDFDLGLYDCQPSCLLGIDKEFISSGRLDNLASTLTALHAIINSLDNLENQSSLNFIACFDNEEIGSQSFQGADCEFFGNNLLRIFTTINANENESKSNDSFLACCARSFVVSADMAHAIHPNYTEKHQPQHRPYIHDGVVIKVNANMRYATDSESSAILKEIGKNADVPIQEFMVKQDSPCGSTIGPIISGKLGIKTADVGVSQLSMHSIREMCGVVDVYHYRRFFEEFYNSYEKFMMK